MRHARRHTLPERLRSPYLWHRWGGLALALFLVWMAASGLLLNHADDLKLDATPVHSAWMLSAWGIPRPELGPAYLTPAGWVVAVDEVTYLRDAPLDGGALIGVAVQDDLTLVATATLLHLIGPDGALIESMAPPASPVRTIGTVEGGRFGLVTPGGTLAADAATLEWRPTPESPQSQSPAALPAASAATLLDTAYATKLSWERVLLDLHAGRMPARWGRWLLDLIALGIIGLAASGCWIHLHRRRRRPARD